MSYEVLDPEWDRFVGTLSGRVHMQSIIWSAFKATGAWSPIRAILRRNGSIVGGAQVLVRQLPFGFTIARVPQGPITSNCDPELFMSVQ